MNCKPGDLAIIIGSADGYDISKLVEVLYAAPSRNFVGPDGAWYEGCPSGCWLVQRLSGLFTIGTPSGLVRGLYCAIMDYRLRPLPGPSITESTPERADSTA